MSGFIQSIQEKVAVLFRVKKELRRSIHLDRLRILDVLKRILFSETLVEFIFYDEPALILKLLVVNFPQSVNIVETLHEIVEFFNLKGLKLVAKESVEHLGKLLICIKID